MKENQQIEWKESWRDEFLKSVCAFANSDGGVVVIGRNNKGKVVGLANAPPTSCSKISRTRSAICSASW